MGEAAITRGRCSVAGNSCGVLHGTNTGYLQCQDWGVHWGSGTLGACYDETVTSGLINPLSMGSASNFRLQHQLYHHGQAWILVGLWSRRGPLGSSSNRWLEFVRRKPGESKLWAQCTEVLGQWICRPPSPQLISFLLWSQHCFRGPQRHPLYPSILAHWEPSLFCSRANVQVSPGLWPSSLVLPWCWGCRAQTLVPSTLQYILEPSLLAEITNDHILVSNWGWMWEVTRIKPRWHPVAHSLSRNAMDPEYLIILICISLVTNDVEHLSIFLLATEIIISVKALRFCEHFTGNKWLQSVSQSVTRLYTLLTVSCDKQKFLILMMSDLSGLFFYG